jgi:hypothetical protein
MRAEIDQSALHTETRNLSWYCRRSLHLLLDNVDVQSLSEEKLAELEQFDFHHFPEIGLHSVTFVQGSRAVGIIRGIREGRWTKDQVLAAIGAAA